MKVPIVCLTETCPNHGNLINMVSNISPPDLDMFYEAFTEPEEADFCPACGQLGLMEDPEIEHAWEELYFADDELRAWTDYLWQKREQ